MAARRLLLDVGEQQAVSAEHAGIGRHDDGGHLQQVGDRRRHDRAVAAEGEQGEIPRVAAAVGRDRLDGAHHGAAGDLQDAVGGVQHVPAQHGGDPLGDRLRGSPGVDGEAAADQIIRVEPAEGQHRVAEGRLRAALPVGDRPGHGAGAVRPDADQPAGVDPHQAAAAGADLRNVDDRQLERVAAAHDQLARQVDAGADLVVAGPGDLAGLDDGGLGRGAAHVEGDAVGDPVARAGVGRADHAGGRAGLDDIGRFLRCGRGAHDAAVGFHHQDRRRDADAVQMLPQPAEIAPDHRAEIGVDDGRAGPLVLPDDRQEIAGAGEEYLVAEPLARRIAATRRS